MPSEILVDARAILEVLTRHSRSDYERLDAAIAILLFDQQDFGRSLEIFRRLRDAARKRLDAKSADERDEARLYRFRLIVRELGLEHLRAQRRAKRIA